MKQDSCGYVVEIDCGKEVNGCLCSLFESKVREG